jgi:serine/threonine-protein kinase
MLETLGYRDRLRDSASGFQYNTRYIIFDRQRGSEGRLERLLIGRPAPIEFWYRESPQPLVVNVQPLPHGPPRLGGVLLTNPPPDEPGMRYVMTDVRGRLTAMRAVPPESGVTAVGSANWDPLFAAAGLDRHAFEPAEPEWTPPDASDEHAAWKGVYPEQPDLPLRLEAAAYKGHIVAFRMFGPWDSASSAEIARLVRSGVLVGTFVYTLSLVGLILAWLNVRLGRGDKPGALRLGLFVLIASVAEWALNVDHVAGPGELMLFRQGLGTALVQAVSAYIVYLALEPHVRRRWPQVLISWSRVLGGRFRDPLVGRDILVGIALAGVWALVWTVTVWGFGRVSDGDIQISTVLSVRRGTAAMIAIVANAVFMSVAMCFLVLVMRVVWRNALLAALATIVFWSVTLSGGAPLGNAFQGVIGAATGAVATLALFRFGLLATITSIAAQLLYASVRAGAGWHGVSGIITLLAILGVAAYAAYLAVGRPAILPRRQTSQTI